MLIGNKLEISMNKKRTKSSTSSIRGRKKGKDPIGTHDIADRGKVLFEKHWGPRSPRLLALPFRSPDYANLMVETNFKPGRRSEFFLSPLILSVIGLLMFIHFGIIVNISPSLQDRFLSDSNLTSLQANILSSIGLIFVMLGVIVFALVYRWYDDKAYFHSITEQSLIERMILIVGYIFTIVIIVFAFPGAVLFGVSANITLPIAMSLVVLFVGVLLIQVRKNALSLPNRWEKYSPSNLRLVPIPTTVPEKRPPQPSPAARNISITPKSSRASDKKAAKKSVARRKK
jgi:uncharacterized protein YjeT (DUF2065 family)